MFVFAFAAWLTSAVGVAADAPDVPDPQYGMYLYLRHCAACHGRQAWGDGPREIPALAGQHETYLIEQLRRFAADERAGSAMHGSAMRDTLKATDANRPPAIRDLAAYLAHAPQAAEADRGDGRALAAGGSAYLRLCAGCHGQDGAGPDGGSVPRIGGQHFPYVLARLRDFGTTHRGQGEPRALSAQEQQALADFISRLPRGASAP
jgi:cytochrome c553